MRKTVEGLIVGLLVYFFGGGFDAGAADYDIIKAQHILTAVERRVLNRLMIKWTTSERAQGAQSDFYQDWKRSFGATRHGRQSINKKNMIFQPAIIWSVRFSPV